MVLSKISIKEGYFKECDQYKSKREKRESLWKMYQFFPQLKTKKFLSGIEISIFPFKCNFFKFPPSFFKVEKKIWLADGLIVKPCFAEMYLHVTFSRGREREHRDK